MALSRNIRIAGVMANATTMRFYKVDYDQYTSDFYFKVFPQSGPQQGVDLASGAGWAQENQSNGFTHFMDIAGIQAYDGINFDVKIKETSGSAEESFTIQVGIWPMNASLWSFWDSGAPTFTSDPTSSNIASTSATISWNAPAVSHAATSYKLFRSGSAWGSFVEIATGLTSPTFNDTNLLAGSNNFYRTRAVNASGAGPFSGYLNVVTPAASGSAPDAPTAGTMNATQTTIEIFRVANGSVAATGSKFFISTSSNGTYTQIASQGLGNYVATGLTPGTTYYFKVIDFNANGDSAYSNVTYGTTLAASGGGTVPTAPVLSIGNPTASTVDLSWAAVSGATGYKVFRSSTSSTSGFAQMGGTLTGTSYTPTGLTSSTTYWFYVVATNATGDSVESNVVTSTTATAGGGGTVPNAPLLAFANATTNSVQLTAVPSGSGSAATGFKFYQSTSPNSGFVQIASQSGTTFTATGLSASTTYYFKAVAYNATGNSADSNTQTVQTSAAGGGGGTVPAAPVLTTGAIVANSVSLSWAAVSGAASYKVFQSSTSSTTGFVQVGGTQTGTSYVATGLTASTQYWFRMVATNATGDSANSNTVSATTTAGGGTATATPTITPNSSGTIFRQQYEHRGTAEANAIMEIEAGTTVLTATANSSGAWEVNPTDWLPQSATQIRVRATAPGKTTSAWSAYVPLADATASNVWAQVYAQGSSYAAFLVGFTGTAYAPGTKTRGVQISAALRSTEAAAKADIVSYFDNN